MNMVSQPPNSGSLILSCSLSCLLLPPSPTGTLEVRVSEPEESFPGRLDCVETEEPPVPFPLCSHFLLGVIMYGCLGPL